VETPLPSNSPRTKSTLLTAGLSQQLDRGGALSFRCDTHAQDARYMATILMDNSKVVVLDIRYPTMPVAELQRHQACVNALAWAPHSSCHICTAGDDTQVTGALPQTGFPTGDLGYTGWGRIQVHCISGPCHHPK
jgi:hypothetical protein